MDSRKITHELTLPDLGRVEFDLGNDMLLRNFAVTDAAAIYAVVKRNEVHLHFMQWISPDYSLQSAEEFVDRSAKNAASGEALSLGLFVRGRLIGSVGFVHFEKDARRTEIGYWIDQDFEGKGLVSLACKRLIDFAFDDLGMNRIEIRCSAENERSSAIPRRLGFKLEAHLREQEVREGQLHDFLTFGLLRREWKAAL